MSVLTSDTLGTREFGKYSNNKFQSRGREITHSDKARVVVPLFHRMYAVPLIACLYREKGAKFVTLVHRLGAGRDTISMTIRYLAARGIVQRNPGYGHPMRPEYTLTRHGMTLGPACAELLDAVHALDIDHIAFRKWPMPVVTAIGTGTARFSDVLHRLDGITPRALTGALRDLDASRVVDRRVTDSWPPRPEYAVGAVGEALLPSLERLTLAARVAL